MLQYINSNSKNPAKIVHSYQTDFNINNLTDALTMSETPIVIDKIAVQYTNKEQKKITKPVSLEQLDVVYNKYHFDIWMLECDYNGIPMILRFSDKKQRLDIISKDNNVSTVEHFVIDIDNAENNDSEFSQQFTEELDALPEDNMFEDPRSKSGQRKNKNPQAMKKNNTGKMEGDHSTLYIVLSILEMLSGVGFLFGLVALIKSIGAKNKLAYDYQAAEDGFKSARLFLIIGLGFIILMGILTAVSVAMLLGAASSMVTP